MKNGVKKAIGIVILQYFIMFTVCVTISVIIANSADGYNIGLEDIYKCYVLSAALILPSFIWVIPSALGRENDNKTYLICSAVHFALILTAALLCLSSFGWLPTGIGLPLYIIGFIAAYAITMLFTMRAYKKKAAALNEKLERLKNE